MVVRQLLSAAGLAAVAACSTPRDQASEAPGPPPVAPAVAGPDLAGQWDFTVDMGGRITGGAMSLIRASSGYAGTVKPEGNDTVHVRSLVLTGHQVDMVVDTREGEVTFAGTLDSAGRAMTGILTYHEGRQFPFEAKKR